MFASQWCVCTCCVSACLGLLLWLVPGLFSQPKSRKESSTSCCSIKKAGGEKNMRCFKSKEAAEFMKPFKRVYAVNKIQWARIYFMRNPLPFSLTQLTHDADHLVSSVLVNIFTKKSCSRQITPTFPIYMQLVNNEISPLILTILLHQHLL